MREGGGVSVRTSGIVRIVHRVSDRVCLEYDIRHLRPDELSKWVKSIEHYWDSLIFRIEWPDDLEDS